MYFGSFKISECLPYRDPKSENSYKQTVASANHHMYEITITKNPEKGYKKESTHQKVLHKRLRLFYRMNDFNSQKRLSLFNQMLDFNRNP